MRIEPYLFFEGRCEEALDFYRQALGATVLMKMRFNQAPPGVTPMAPPGEKIMHATMQVGDSLFYLSDGNCQGKPANFDGFSLSLAVDDVAAAERIYAALAVGGNPFLPLSRTFFSPMFGMLADRFGVRWQIMVRPEQ